MPVIQNNFIATKISPTGALRHRDFFVYSYTYTHLIQFNSAFNAQTSAKSNISNFVLTSPVSFASYSSASAMQTFRKDVFRSCGRWFKEAISRLLA